MPRAPKPKHLRQNTERVDIGEVPDDPPPALALEVPKPPPGLLKTTRESWHRYFTSAAVHVTVLSLDLDTLERLWILYDERTRAQAELRKPQRDALGKPIRGTSSRVVEGSKGQMRASPFYQVIARLDAEIRQLEDRVAKSMKSRLTLGMVVGSDDSRSAADDEPDTARPAAPDEDDGPSEDPRLYVVARNAG